MSIDVIDSQRFFSSERSLGGASSIGLNSIRYGCFTSTENVPASSPMSSWQRSGPDLGGQKSPSDSAARSAANRNRIFFPIASPSPPLRLSSSPPRTTSSPLMHNSFH